ncbi:MAG: molecular chaperone DnaJ [Patescibacteria group bacterium]|jgi:molecular chaperone DnaJ
MADYYKTLGVEKGASEDEIKKAYRQAAQKYHPDKPGGNAEKFKEISEAYQTLSDPEKRKLYEEYGSAFKNAKTQGGFSGFDNFRDFASYAEAMKNQGERGNAYGGEDFGFGDLGDIFNSFFGGGFNRASSHSRRESPSGRNIEIEITVNFFESVFGIEKDIEFEKYVKCEKCNGNGLEPGSKFSTCKTCGGRGQVIKTQSTFLGTFQSAEICPSCHGEGQNAEKKCSHCRGEGRVKQYSKIKIKIPAGISSGQTIRLSGQGEAGKKNGRAGDLYVRIKVISDNRFNRQGDDILSEKEISVSQAILGGVVEVETIDGMIKLKVAPGTSSGQEIRLKGRGVVHLNSHGRGDHIVTIKIQIPKSLTRKQKDILETLSKEGL